MKIHCIAAILFLLTGPSCTKRKSAKMLWGTWKIEKIELLKNGKPESPIDAGIQFWSFSRRGDVVIFNHTEVQNRLKVDVEAHFLRNVTSEEENIPNKFLIDTLNGARLQLTTNQVIGDALYTVHYCLDKVDSNIGALPDDPGR